jgi:Tfp pilus assembly protein PilO
MLALLGMVAILAGGWFLLVSPKKASVAEVEDQTSSQQSLNRATKGRIDLLTKQAKDLPKKQAELARLAQQLPSNPALPGLIRSLTTAADEAGVVLVGLLPAQPAEQQSGVTTTVTSAKATSTAKTTTAKTTSTSTTRAAASNEALYAIPVEIQVRGGYFQIENFVSAMEKLQRSLIVGQLVLQPAEDASKKVEVRPGELSGTISARVFMLGPKPVVTPKKTSASAATAK